MKPYFCIFLTVSAGNASVSSTSCASGFTSVSAKSLNKERAISCFLSKVKSMISILLVFEENAAAIAEAEHFPPIIYILLCINRSLSAVRIVYIETFSALCSKVAATNHFTDQWACTIFAVACLFVKNIHDCKADIKTDEIT